jgi:signal peptidase II
MKKKYIVFAILFALSLAADQGTKIWARGDLKNRPFCGPHVGAEVKCRPITVIKGYFDITYSENEGSAFGLFRGTTGARWILFGVGILALGVVLNSLRTIKDDQLRIAGELGLLAGGAMGNIIDRVLFGKVTDFILWKLQTHEWPVFNVADAALVVGVIALVIDMREKKDEKDEKDAKDAKKDEEPAPKSKKRKK